MRTLIAFVAAVLSGTLAQPALADPANSAPRAAPLAEPAPTVAPAPRTATPVEPAPAARAAPADPAPSRTLAPAAPVAASRVGVPPAAPPQLPTLDVSAVPAPCQPLVKPAQAARIATALSARITLANCMADHAIAPIGLCDCAASIVAIDTAVAPALAVLDGVIDAGDPTAQVLAEHAEGQLYAGFVRRLVATLPRTGPDASDAEIALADMRRQTLDAQLAPWREAALAEFQHAVEIARAHPDLASNPAVASAVRDAEQRLASDVATR